LKAIAFKVESTSQCLNELNYLLSQDNPKSMFVTMFYGVLNIKSGYLEYSNGGHNFPFIITKDSNLTSLNHGGGLALGVYEEFEYQSNKILLKPGDCLVLYTDGIPEAINKNDEEFSDHQLKDFFKKRASISSSQIIHDLIQDIASYTNGVPQSDDITAMVLKYNQ
jgi:sigma-B regulation protein RsbU (phosphoserine phosphatase)